MKKEPIKVGHDSECFAYRKGIGLFPMIGLVGGTKHTPLPVPGGTLQEDNVSIEMAIDCTADEDEFVELTHKVKQAMEAKVKEHNCTLLIEPSVEFSRQVIELNAPESEESGCEPDFNIYTKAENRYPSMHGDNYRHGSGHIHVDCPIAVDSTKAMARLVMIQDLFIKVPQWLIEGNVPRNEVQGGFGNYRPKSYGVEYRSSSNIILTDDRILRHAFRQAVRASKMVTEAQCPNVSLNHISDIRKAMHEGKVDKLKQYMSYYQIEEIV